MEKIDLIQTRSFGEKLNELTSLIYDNFVPLMRQSWWLLLAMGIALAAIYRFFPAETTVEGWSCFVLTAFLCTLLVIMFVVLVRVVGIEQRSLPDRRSFFVQALVLGGRSLTTLLLPLGLLCVFGGLLVSFITSMDITNKFGQYFLLLLLILVIILAVAPLLLLINVCVLEEKSGFAAVKRMFRLLFHRPIPALMFYFVIVLLTMLVPTVVELPYLIYAVTRNLVTDEYGVTVDPEMSEQIIDFVFEAIGWTTFVLYICVASMASLLEYGNAVEEVDNVHFLEKFNNFDNL